MTSESILVRKTSLERLLLSLSPKHFNCLEKPMTAILHWEYTKEGSSCFLWVKSKPTTKVKTCIHSGTLAHDYSLEDYCGPYRERLKESMAMQNAVANQHNRRQYEWSYRWIPIYNLGWLQIAKHPGKVPVKIQHSYRHGNQNITTSLRSFGTLPVLPSHISNRGETRGCTGRRAGRADNEEAHCKPHLFYRFPTPGWFRSGEEEGFNWTQISIMWSIWASYGTSIEFLPRSDKKECTNWRNELSWKR
jgi:hypothetical protein